MADSLNDVIPEGYMLCRKCVHRRHDGICGYIEPVARGRYDSHRCRCGEVRGTTSNLLNSGMRATEKMTVGGHRNLPAGG